MISRRLFNAVLAASALAVAGCAAPALSLFTLAAPTAGKPQAPLPGKPMVIEVARISLPDEIDSEDMLVRNGPTLIRSSTGRWASRLSLQATDRVTARLAERRPDALVVNRAQAQSPSYRIVINISRLDVLPDGSGVMEADWQIIPSDSAIAALRDRGSFTTRQEPVKGDSLLVAGIGDLLDQLAGAIKISALR
jgi:uncharacterized lipoprotein YmbA